MDWPTIYKSSIRSKKKGFECTCLVYVLFCLKLELEKLIGWREGGDSATLRHGKRVWNFDNVTNRCVNQICLSRTASWNMTLAYNPVHIIYLIVIFCLPSFLLSSQATNMSHLRRRQCSLPSLPFLCLSLSLSWPPPISLSIVRLARMQLFFGTICGLNFFTTAHHHIPLQKREERLLLLPLWLKRMKRRTMKRG